MAQLPPRVPNWPPSFPSHNRSPAQAPPSWVDEFLDFTSARRGNHRRSASDSVAYLESPLINNSGDAAFERLDDDQLLSMFSDDLAPPAAPGSNSGNSSDPNSPDDDKQPDLAPAAKAEPPEPDTECDPNTTSIDPKRVKRILANRQSAQRSRVRKLQYISELERSVTTLQTEVSALSPRVAFLDHQRLILNVDNSALKQRIAALAQDKIFKDAHQEALKKEIERLRQIYSQQNNINKVSNSDAGGQSPAPASDGMAFTPEKQLITS